MNGNILESLYCICWRFTCWFRVLADIGSGTGGRRLNGKIFSFAGLVEVVDGAVKTSCLSIS
jgi:hypothetical protein